MAPDKAGLKQKKKWQLSEIELQTSFPKEVMADKSTYGLKVSEVHGSEFQLRVIKTKEITSVTGRLEARKRFEEQRS